MVCWPIQWAPAMSDLGTIHNTASWLGFHSSAFHCSLNCYSASLVLIGYEVAEPSVFVHVFISTFVYVFTSVFVYVFTSVFTSVFICVFVFVFLFVFVWHCTALHCSDRIGYAVAEPKVFVYFFTSVSVIVFSSVFVLSYVFVYVFVWHCTALHWPDRICSNRALSICICIYICICICVCIVICISICISICICLALHRMGYAVGELWVFPGDRSRRSPPSSLQGGTLAKRNCQVSSHVIKCHQISHMSSDVIPCYDMSSCFLRLPASYATG